MTTCSHQASTEPLSFLMEIFVRSVNSDHPDLTNRQLALLLTIYLRPLPHTVRGLSACLSLTKPVVSRALKHLESFGFLKRLKGLSDRRDMFVERTPVGAAFLVEFSDGLPPTAAVASVSRTAGRALAYRESATATP